jgi:hypothetical protein
VTLLDAAYALDEFSAGPTPGRGRLLAGVRALDEVRVEDTAAVRDFLDAAAERYLVATERYGGISEVGRGARLMHPLAINPALPS